MSFTLERFIDKGIGNVLCALFGLPLKVLPKRSIKQPKRILIVKLWAMGESVLTLPLIKALHSAYPDAQIDVLARKRNAYIYKDLQYVTTVHLFEPNKTLQFARLFKQYDWSFDCEPYLRISALASLFCAKQRFGFKHTLRSWLYTNTVQFNDQQHEVLTFLDLAKSAGITQVPQALEKLPYSDKDKKNVDNLLKEHGVQSDAMLTGMCISVAETSSSRKWPLERYAAVANILKSEYNAHVFVTGSKAEYAANEEFKKMAPSIINLAGLPLGEFFYLAERANLFISNDTGPMHVAAAQGTKTIGLFGPNLPVRFAPYGEGNIALRNCEHEPIINVHRGEFRNCPNQERGEACCMKNITVNHVMEAVQKCLT